MGETTAVAHGGNPQDRTASPRPHCLPKTALPSQDRAASLLEVLLKKTGKHWNNAELLQLTAPQVA
ncbi:hypothetical protein BJP34_26925 [Moorena producens PAL-8-15-08-1]|uniref:Uncharacterized protein n=1 Tax=Moorena producens PAL-8-15-08-1 TaxID=1458985 RepID=A0A1D8TYH8_9CYAN|nr:hypothetical protein BJP34_26925 [Moorena producens PAL-8-15-08-1]